MMFTSKYKNILYAICVLSVATSLNAQTYCTGDEFILHAESYISGEIQWQYSYDNTNWFDYEGATSLEYTVNIESDIYLRLQITDPECMPIYYTDFKHIELLPQPDNANAGEDQLELVGNSTTLNANLPENGTGFWSITSGEGGTIDDIYNNTSSFNGVSGNTYTLRWLIYNDCGYTEDIVTISFAEELFTCGDALVDSRDDQSYPTVEIGGKCWMAANLNVGTQLTGYNSSADNGTIEKFCYDDDVNNCNTFGGLYQWDEAMQYTTTESAQGICPSGWHIPSDEEVKQLEMSLGMTQIDADTENTWRGISEQVGTQMKEGGSSGFNVKLGGVRTSSGSFLYLEGNTTQFGYIWCSTEASNYPSETYAYRRCWEAASVAVGRYDTFNKLYSYPIRCVKDE